MSKSNIPTLPKTISKTRRAWLRGLKAGDQVALWDGYAWSQATITGFENSGKLKIAAVDHYSRAELNVTTGYNDRGQFADYIGPVDKHEMDIKASESWRFLWSLRKDDFEDAVIIKVVEILRAAQKKPLSEKTTEALLSAQFAHQAKGLKARYMP